MREEGSALPLLEIPVRPHCFPPRPSHHRPLCCRVGRPMMGRQLRTRYLLPSSGGAAGNQGRYDRERHMLAIRVNRLVPANGSNIHLQHGVLMAGLLRIHGLHAHRRGSDVRAAGSVLPALYGLHVHRASSDVRAVGCTTRSSRPPPVDPFASGAVREMVSRAQFAASTSGADLRRLGSQTTGRMQL